MAERCGLSENVIENIETGRPDDDGNRRRDVTVDELMAIARALGISAVELLPEESSRPTEHERAEARHRYRERQAEIARLMGEMEQRQQAQKYAEQALHAAMVSADEIRREIQRSRQAIARLQAEMEGKSFDVG